MGTINRSLRDLILHNRLQMERRPVVIVPTLLTNHQFQHKGKQVHLFQYFGLSRRDEDNNFLTQTPRCHNEGIRSFNLQISFNVTLLYVNLSLHCLPPPVDEARTETDGGGGGVVVYRPGLGEAAAAARSADTLS